VHEGLPVLTQEQINNVTIKGMMTVDEKLDRIRMYSGQ
jgi:hypothetical protein